MFLHKSINYESPFSITERPNIKNISKALSDITSYYTSHTHCFHQKYENKCYISFRLRMEQI